MDKVTIKDLYWELSSDEMLRNFIWDGCKDIEIVPRKMVEILIEKCDKEIEHCAEYTGNEYYDGRSDGVATIKYFAEALLKQFEEDKE